MGIDPGGFPDTQLRHYVQRRSERPKVQAPPTSRHLSRLSNAAGQHFGTHPVFRWQGLYSAVLQADGGFSKSANGVLRWKGASRAGLQDSAIWKAVYELALPVCQGLRQRQWFATDQLERRALAEVDIASCVLRLKAATD